MREEKEKSRTFQKSRSEERMMLGSNTSRIAYIVTEEICQEPKEDKYWNRNDLHLGIKVGYSKKNPTSTKR